MKEEFELPEKWYIKWQEEVGKYFNIKCGSYCYTEERWKYLCSHNDHGDSIFNANNKTRRSFGDIKVGEEITFEQFQKHVLGIEIEEPITKDEDYSYLIPIMKELNII